MRKRRTQNRLSGGDQTIIEYLILKSIIMKNQSINSEKQVNSIDLNTAKSPLNQPLAGKQLNNSSDNQLPDAKSTGQEDHKTLAPNHIPNNPQPLKDQATAKPTMNLEGTLKLVEDLHRRMVQRGRLVHTIDNLDKFEIEQKEEAEDSLSNYYQGCEIQITDDQRNKFSTKNPVIIKAVALFVRELCMNRLAEIEAEIIIPA